MLVSTKAIVLRQLKYGEQQLIVDLLTEELGRLSFMVRMPKTSKAKVKKQFFQPLSILEVVFDYRQRSQLQRLRDVRVAVPYFSAQTNPVKLTILLFLAEFLGYATRGVQKDVLLFGFVEHSLVWLDTASQGYANFHLVFMLRMSRFIGFYPNMDTYVDGAFFDLREGRFTTAVPVHPDFLKPDEAAPMSTLFRLNFTTMHLMRLNRKERNRITELIVRYYRLHLPEMPELKSYAVLKEMFD